MVPPTTTRSVETSDGLGLHVDVWEPDGPPRFVVVISHGAGEYVGRYDHVATMLQLEGALVFGPDHRGQGRSGGPRGHVERFEQYGDDLLAVVLALVAERPEWQRPDRLPWFLFGHSMGGLIALTYLLDHRRSVPLRGVVLSAPLLQPRVELGPLRWAALEVLGVAAPWVAFRSGLGADTLSRDRKVNRALASDPRGARRYSVAWLRAMRRAVERVQRELPELDLPMLWYVGTADAVVDHRATLRTFDVLPEPRRHDQRIEVFDGYFHELHNEPERERARVLELVREWILERTRPMSH